MNCQYYVFRLKPINHDTINKLRFKLFCDSMFCFQFKWKSNDFFNRTTDHLAVWQYTKLMKNEGIYFFHSEWKALKLMHFSIFFYLSSLTNSDMFEQDSLTDSYAARKTARQRDLSSPKYVSLGTTGTFRKKNCTAPAKINLKDFFRKLV